MKNKYIENLTDEELLDMKKEKKKQYNQRYIEKIKTEGRTIHCALCSVHVPVNNYTIHLTSKNHKCNQKIHDLETENETLRKQVIQLTIESC